MIEQGDLLLVPFPFSDQSGRKIRPVVVISNSKFNEFSNDLIVVGVTSNISRDKYTLGLGNNDLDEGKLISDWYIKVESILKIDKSIIIKKIGKLNIKKLSKIKEIINFIID